MHHRLHNLPFLATMLILLSGCGLRDAEGERIFLEKLRTGNIDRIVFRDEEERRTNTVDGIEAEKSFRSSAQII